jgi:hypothetical protein
VSVDSAKTGVYVKYAKIITLLLLKSKNVLILCDFYYVHYLSNGVGVYECACLSTPVRPSAGWDFEFAIADWKKLKNKLKINKYEMYIY